MRQTEDNRVIYNVYMTPNSSSNEAIVFDDLDEAIIYAKENNAYEVEQMWWNSYEDYNNYEPADGYRKVW